MVGSHRQHDYDELMELGAEPARQPIQIRHAPPPLPQHAVEHAPMHPSHTTHVQHPQVPPQRHEIHHHYAPPADAHAHQQGHESQHSEAKRRRLVAEEPTHERQFPVGFMFSNIAPGDEEDIEVKPQVYFRGERLALPPSLARYFDILDIKVGKDSQLAATGTMPGESFSAHAVGVRMELDTAKPGIVITIRVRNVDTAPHDFKAVLYGAVLE
ncbi:MAG: hypothetical protein ABI461_17930 [Polyangiaceae bacterium]